MAEMEIPRPASMLVCLLGASGWPKYPEFYDSASFEKSAHGIRNYFLSEDGFNLPKENLLDLFDATSGPLEVLSSLRDFIRERTRQFEQNGDLVRDVLLYFIGHGGFAKGGSQYCLAIRSTEKSALSLSSIPIDELANSLNQEARNCRRYLILDCCFAASAFKTFQAPPSDIANLKTGEAFSRGTALLCSSGAKDISLAPEGHEHTMFTGALLDCLQAPHENMGNHISVAELGELVRQRIYEKFEGEAVRPEVHSPAQSKGKLENLPMFPNQYGKAWQKIEPKRSTGRITVLLGGIRLGAPDDLEAEIVNFIDYAEKSVDISTGELSSEPVVQAVINAKERGVSVHIVLRFDSLRVLRPSEDPWRPDGQGEDARRAFSALLRADIDVRLEQRNDELIAKRFIIRDSGRPRRSVLLASCNFSEQECCRTSSNLIVVDDQWVANEWDAEFAHLFSLRHTQRESSLSPRVNWIADVLFRNCIAAYEDPENRIVTELLKAKHRVDFRAFHIKSYSILMTLHSLLRNGVQVRGVLDLADDELMADLTRAGAKIYKVARLEEDPPRICGKLFVIDGLVLIGGGVRHEDPVGQFRQEDIWVLGDHEPDNPESKSQMQSLAKYVIEEIDREIVAHRTLAPL